jgi:hypothetical protein
MSKISQIDGLPVINAKKPIQMTITKADCKNGNPKHPDTCAAARCLMRELHASEVRVHLSRVYVKTTPDKWVRFMTTKPLRTEIIAFDRGGTFEPGTYHLSAVRKSVRSRAARKPVRKPGSRPQNGTRSKRHVVTDVRTGPA